ncbi:MAG: hypothetical protein ABI837_04325 [Acidobacteriota bacterium]
MKRALPLLAVLALFFGGMLVWAGGNRRVAQTIYDADSAANTGDHGTSLAFRYLRGTNRRKMAMLTLPLDAARLESNAVVFRIVEDSAGVVTAVDPEDDEDDDAPKKLKTPSRVARRLLTAGEEEFVSHGGRLVIAASGEVGSLERRNVEQLAAERVFPMWRGLDRIGLPDRSAFAAATLGPRMHTLFAAGNDSVVAREVLGRGDIILISVPRMFTNQSLSSGNHLQLLAALAGERRPVYFDEWVHGMTGDEGALDLLREWNLGPFLALLALGGLLVLWRNSRRIGPAEDDHRERRSDAVDLVASLGALYASSTSDREALASYRDTLTRSVASQSGLRGEALQRRAAALTGGATLPPPDTKLTPAEFMKHLAILNDAFRKLEHASLPTGATHANHR